MRKILVYSSLGLLILRGILWYSDNYIKRDAEESIAVGHYLTHKADSLKLSRMSTTDSTTVSRLKSVEKQLLNHALRYQQDARDQLNFQLNVLEKLELVTNIFMGITLLSLIVYWIRGQ